MDDDYTWVTGGDQDLLHTRKIANGSFGTVHELRSVTDGNVFARKVLRWRDNQPLEVQSEFRAIEKLCNGENDNIIRVIRMDELPSKESWYIDMELCNFTLRKYIEGSRYYASANAHGQAFFVSRAWDVMIQIAAGLAFIHAKEYIHRDLKPQNVLFAEKDRKWKISDFGFSSEGSSITFQHSGNCRGTECYRAPELLFSSEVNQLADIWALGCISYELVTGEPLFRNDWMSREYKDSDLLELLDNKTLSNDSRTDMSNCLRDMLRRDPELRPPVPNLLECFRRNRSRMSPTTLKGEAEQKVEQEPVEPQSENAPNQEDAIVDGGIESHQTNSPRMPPGWTIITVLVNKPNTRIAIHMSDEDCTESRVELWNTNPLELLLLPEVLNQPYASKNYVNIAFTEDGRHLALAVGKDVQIIDAQTAFVLTKYTLPSHLTPNSLAAARDGKRIAVWMKPDSIWESIHGIKSTPTIHTEEISNGKVYVDVITTPKEASQVSLTYAIERRRLFALYKPHKFVDQTIIGQWFDFRSNNLVNAIPFPDGQYQNGPLLCLQTGIVVASSHPSNSPHTILSLCARNGTREDKFGAEEIIYGRTGGGFLLMTRGNSMWWFDPTYSDPELGPEYREAGEWFLVERTHGAYSRSISLWEWNGEEKKPRWKGILRPTRHFDFDDVKALAEIGKEKVLIITEDVTKEDLDMIPATIHVPDPFPILKIIK